MRRCGFPSAGPRGSDLHKGSWLALRLPTAIVGQPFRLNAFGTPQRHAAIAAAVGPVGITAISAWRMVVMG